MSKKIIIAFNSEPTVGVAFNYTIQVNGLNLVYGNGLDNISFEYQAFGGTDPEKVEIQNNIDLTIDETLAFMSANFISDIITYARVNDTIEVTVNTDLFTVVYIGALNPSIVINTSDISNITTVNLKYFFQYKNLVGDDYYCEIFKKNYTGTSQEISGRAILEKASVKTHLDPIRGGGITLKLDATDELTLEDLYSENEQDFTVKLYKNNKIMFNGYLHPDGVYQDYTKDGWVITLDCVDGLGTIANLSFVQSNGLHFTGKMLAIDIIYQCLKRTGILLPINTSVNTTYEGSTLGFDVFRTIYLNTDRFVKTDNDTIMSCDDVLRSVLDIFKACITQWDGEWYIYKPNEIYINPYVLFKRYDITNNFIGNKTINLNKSLGSHIDNFYPHHIGGNQKIEIKNSIGSFRLGYKYGFVNGFLENSGLVKNGNSLNYDGWVVEDTTNLINDPLKSSGFYFKNNAGPTLTNAIESNPLEVEAGDLLSIRGTYTTYEDGINHVSILFEAKIGPYYFDSESFVWTTSPHQFRISISKNGVFTAEFPPIPIDGFLTIAVNGCFDPILVDFLNSRGTTLIQSLDIVPTVAENAPQGEFHTVSRANMVSSMVKENQTVFNGDNPSIVYLGAIFNEALDPTEFLWSRFNSSDKLPLLQIAAEEELRIAQRPLKIFRGDIYGYIPYLSLISINNVGNFMPIEWSYDTFTNITQCRQLELHAPELSDIVYKYTLDYGETVKPTIK